MKATHVVIEDEERFLKAGEKVYITNIPNVFEIVTVQSVTPSYKDGLWSTALSNLKLIPTNLENK